MQFMALDREGLAKQAQHLKGDLLAIGDSGTACVADLGDQRDEFVTSDARDGVFVAQTPQQTKGDRLQQLVTDAVSEGVVDGLEMVHVEEQHRTHVAVPL